jgi:hypothetical protein
VAGGERGQRGPAAVAGLAPVAAQHEFFYRDLQFDRAIDREPELE